jgi:hypothetical protein
LQIRELKFGSPPAPERRREMAKIGFRAMAGGVPADCLARGIFAVKIPQFCFILPPEF